MLTFCQINFDALIKGDLLHNSLSLEIKLTFDQMNFTVRWLHVS